MRARQMPIQRAVARYLLDRGFRALRRTTRLVDRDENVDAVLGRRKAS
jgi:hypothetical protein